MGEINCVVWQCQHDNLASFTEDLNQDLLPQRERDKQKEIERERERENGLSEYRILEIRRSLYSLGRISIIHLGLFQSLKHIVGKSNI